MGPEKVRFPDPYGSTIANSYIGELLHTSNYDLQHTNHRATVGLHLTWPYYYGHSRDVTMGPGKVRFPNSDRFTIANTYTGELLHTSNYKLQHTNHKATADFI